MIKLQCQAVPGAGSKIALFLVLAGRLFQYSAGCPAAIIILPLYTGIYIFFILTPSGAVARSFFAKILPGRANIQYMHFIP